MELEKEDQVTRWHTREPQETFIALETSTDGLAKEEAVIRRQTYGANRIPEPPRRSALMRLMAQFHNVLIYVLVVAGIVTALLDHMVDAGVIAAVVVVNALVGFIQEGKAEKAIDAVRKMLSRQATVTREGHRFQTDAEELVPGDVVFVQSGDRVPADLHLFWTKDLQIEEAVLTGESVPVDKDTQPVSADAALGDRRNIAFSGTLVTYGQGLGVVVETGANTEIGRISTMLAKVTQLTTPLTRQLDLFARWLTGVILAIAALTVVFGVSVHGYTWEEMFMASVGLAVAAIPEGLPAVITIALAIGVQRMANRHAIIRRLPTVETLGSVSVICSDKTGTLTRNEMTVTHVVTADLNIDVTGVGYNPHGAFVLGNQDIDLADHPVLRQLCLASVLCNDSTLAEKEGEWLISGDPTEGALTVLGVKAGYDVAETRREMPRDDLIPFESQHRFMATLHHDHNGQGVVYIKGAIEAILPRCQTQRMYDRDTRVDRDFWLAQQRTIARRGQRTLAIACLPVASGQRTLCFDEVESGLILLGVVGIIDPPRQEAIEAVAQCHEAGINVKMITGDHAETAAAIASQMGITSSHDALTGSELEQMSDDELQQAVQTYDVFARASPEHKLRIVTALQAQDRVVAMTGDGVNDAPALKRADVGVAMGIKGTEAAKEAAEMVLADDNFASIAHAVEEGRTVFDNIRKSILFILPTNGGEALTVLAAIALGTMLPVTAAQILWVNMITAVTLALSLTFEPTETGVMRRMPRDTRAPILSRFMTWRIVFVSLLMVAGTFGLFLWEIDAGSSIEYSRTVAVNTLVMLEVVYLINSRYLYESVLNREGLLGNRYVLMAIGLVVFFQLIFTYTPLMQLFFNVEAIDGGSWLRIIMVALMVFLLVELEKKLMRPFGNSQPPQAPPRVQSPHA
ncbi:cation-transporting P-type ATPase [Pontibacterium granulatum]|uniref:cation-transporting P-type ATPase n=1 Tax=Pontibacterium granulatum TaxID=2036029 RepID=UPI00249A114C|nr:cation-transporting P-type ATPase [Pontibacterium granulatum]MDI3324220.1 cation-transporting P-type ATPase [Pontibacterium granulatum]